MSESMKILERYWKALQSRQFIRPDLPDIPVYRGTLLIRADDTEYHYDDEWCKAADMRSMGERLQAFLTG